MLRKRLPTSIPATFSFLSQRSAGAAQGWLTSPHLPTLAVVRRFWQSSAGLTEIVASYMIWVAVFGGFLLRIFRFDLQPLWFDEGYSLYFANNDFLTMASLTAADIHPPFYYNVLHVWMLFGGPSDVSVRLLSVFTGTLSISLVYALAKRVLDRRLATLSALLLAVSPLHIYYAQEVRMYSLVTLLVLLGTWAFAGVSGMGIHDSPSKWSQKPNVLWVVYIVAESLSLHTQYYAAFVPAGHLAFLLLRRRNPLRLWGNWILAQIIVLMTLLPWLVYAVLRLMSYVGQKVAYENYAPLTFIDFTWRFFVALSEGTERPEAWQWAAIPVVLLATLGLVGWLRRRDGGESAATGDGKLQPHRGAIGSRAVMQSSSIVRDGALLCLVILLLSGFGGWIINQRLPFNPPRWERLYLFSLPFFIILVALGIRWLDKLRPALGWLSLAFCLLVSIPPLYTFYTVPRYPDDDYRPLVKAVSAIGRPDDLVAVVYPWQVGFFQSYYRGPWPKFTIMYGDDWNDTTFREASLRSFSYDHQRIWVPAYQALGAVFERKVEAFMVGHSFPAVNDWYGNTRLLLFNSGREPAQTTQTTDFEGRVKLLNYGLDASAVEAGKGSADVALFWRAQKEIPGKLVVKLRLYDAAGHTWAQRDSEPQAGLRPAATWTTSETVEDRHALLIPAGTPPGEYNLGLSLSVEGNALNIIEANGNPRGQELALGKVKVVRSTFAPRLESVPIRTRVTRYLGDGVEMVGYSQGNVTVKPGETTLVNLFWRARLTPKTDHQAVFTLVDGGGNVVGEQRKALGENYPSKLWTAGEILRDQYELFIPAAATSGVYELRLSFDGNDSVVALDRIRIEGREHSYSSPAVPNSLTAHFGDSISLVGFDLGGEVAPGSGKDILGKIRVGETLTLKLIWRADKEVGSNLRVFTHIIDSGSLIWGQKDSVPGQGTMPTAGWVQDEYLEDAYEITLKPDTPAGTVEIVVGLYDPLSGQRLPARDADDKSSGDMAILGKIEVER